MADGFSMVRKFLATGDHRISIHHHAGIPQTNTFHPLVVESSNMKRE
jgi:hypothetical protein